MKELYDLFEDGVGNATYTVQQPFFFFFFTFSSAAYFYCWVEFVLGLSTFRQNQTKLQTKPATKTHSIFYLDFLLKKNLNIVVIDGVFLLICY